MLRFYTILNPSFLFHKGLDAEIIGKVEAMLYIMAEKFLDSTEMEQLRKEIKMTRLGKMIYDDGLQEGREEGSRERLISLIQKKLAKGKTVEEIADEVEEMPATVVKLMEEMGKA